MKQKSIILALCFITTTIISFTSCKKDKEAPEIPPLSTFKMDFSSFSGSQKSLDIVNSPNDVTDSINTTKNFTFSAFNVGVWNLIITLHAAIPVAAFAESFKHEAKYLGDNEWSWSYDFTVFVKHSAELHAKLINDQVQWKMYISKQGFYSKFLWYEGLSKVSGTEGTWTLYYNPDSSYQYIGIEWHRNTDGTADIKYTNIIPNNVENGGYIFYGITNNSPYNAFYNIYNKGQNNLTEIQWNRTTIIGRVKDSKYFEDNQWHCWNALKIDEACTN